MPQNAPPAGVYVVSWLGVHFSLDILFYPMGYTRWARITPRHPGSFLVAACQVDKRHNNNVG